MNLMAYDFSSDRLLGSSVKLYQVGDKDLKANDLSKIEEFDHFARLC